MRPGLLTTLPLEEILDALQTTGQTTLHGLPGPAQAFVVGEVGRRWGRPLLVICPRPAEAEAARRNLRFFLGEPVALLPEADPDPEACAERVAALWALRSGSPRVVAASAPALLLRTLPPSALEAVATALYPQRLIPRDALARGLDEGGYRQVGQVTGPGEWAGRGGILDCFPAQQPRPIRVEFFGDEIASLREFDPDTQRSLRPVDRVLLLPTSEALLTPETCPRALARIRQVAAEQGTEVPAGLGEALERGAGMVDALRYLPYLFPATATLADYLPAEALVALGDAGQAAGVAAEALAEAKRESRREAEAGGFLPDPAERFVPWETLLAAFGHRPSLRVETFPLPPQGIDGPAVAFTGQGAPAYGGRLAALAEDLRAWRRERRRVLLVSTSPAQARRLQEVLRDHDVGALLDGPPEPGGVAVAVGELQAGFLLPEYGLAVLTEAEVFGPRRERARRPRPPQGPPFASFDDLGYGDYVVHVEHGIGQYKGLRQLRVGGVESDYLYIRYAGSDKLYVPVDKLHLVQRYAGGDGEAPTLDRLGGTSWARAKERVRASIREMARELLELYAARQALPGHACGPDTPWQKEFEAAFPYEETPDQLQAIADVKRDMESTRPLDRLVCGDVGYGKTEVALRAAFKAVMDGRQVALLVPTTVLALQHQQTFRERFAPFPVRVEMLSRFRSAAEQREVLQGLREGTVDIVIGTHRLLQKDVRFRNLGLLVVDEEHRFGVAAKERLKRLRREVDVLTLTATPIPRTLHMGLLGVRDVSVIETPPPERLSIKTFIHPFDPDLIREAIERELARGGQVFFVHNRVESIQGMARLLKRLAPPARLLVAHGELSEDRLERIMVDFYARKADVLLCTTIIESGLDVASANTIIIDRADTLGLAQLYQLRGRVGRDRQRAYAYLLIPREAALGEVARKRLQVMAEFTELGSGFKIAARDLEIRGAGNLLGPEQHGHIAAVGFELYCQLVEATVRELKGEAAEAPVDPTVRLPVETFLPEEYVPDPTARLTLYKRLASVADEARLQDFADELRDRFGELPAPARWLLELMALKLRARVLGIQELDLRRPRLRIIFGPKPPVDPGRVVALVRTERGRLRVLPGDVLEYATDATDPADRVAAARNLLRLLG